MPVKVLMLEANWGAVGLLRRQFSAELAAGQALLCRHVLLPSHTAANLPQQVRETFVQQCHLVVSELLGVSADNEFMPELLAIAHRLFLLEQPDLAWGIPRSYSVWAAPVSCPAFFEHVQRKHDGQLDATYIVGWPGAPQTRLLCSPQPLYSAACEAGPAADAVHRTVFSLSRAKVEGSDTESTPSRLLCHGVFVWFTCLLDESLQIDTRHSSAERNSFHWEAWYLPAAAPLEFSESDQEKKLELAYRRVCRHVGGAQGAGFGGGKSSEETSSGHNDETDAFAMTEGKWTLHYEWKIGEGSRWQNRGGASDQIYLAAID